MSGQQEPSVIVQNEDGTALTEEELASLLAAQQDVEEGSAQIVDPDGNILTVTAEQMASVGIDPNNMGEISEEQLQNLIQLANGEEPPAVEETKVRTTRDQPPHAAQEPSTPGDDNGDLTMVIGDDGSLRLIDPTGTEFLLAADQLVQAGIDVGNLTEDNVQHIVQMALAAGEAEKEQKRPSATEEPASKRMKLRDEVDEDLAQVMGEDGTLRLIDQNGQEIQVPVGERPSTTLSSAMPATARRGGVTGHRNPIRHSVTTAGSSGGLSSNRGYALIGQEVEVRKSGRTLPATIRYCRHGAGYKVQFDDGHFEWVSEDQVQMRQKGSERDGAEGRTGTPKTLVNGDTATTTALGRRVPPAIPGIRVTPQTDSLTPKEPNFQCPICEKKVYQKEPAYIVIRLPACEGCADSKILVLDQEQPAPDSGEQEPQETALAPEIE